MIDILVVVGLILFGIVVGIVFVLAIDKEATDEVIKHHLW